MRTALDTGRLNIPDVAGAVVINAGRLALGPLAAPAQGADVAIAGGYAFGEDALDLRFGLTGAPRPNAPENRRPELSIVLKGPFDTARRTVDVTALVNWLAMREIEQAAPRLEAAEREAARIKAQEEALRAEAERRAQNVPELRAQEQRAQELRVQEQRAQELRAQERAREEAAIRASVPGLDTQPAPESKAPELPPAIEIGPPPRAGELKPRRAPVLDRPASQPAAPLEFMRPDPR